MPSDATDLKRVAALSSVLVLPLVILEVINNPITRQGLPGLTLLFALLWALAAAFLWLLLPAVRDLRAGAFAPQPTFMLRIGLATLAAAAWPAARGEGCCGAAPA